MIAGWLTDEQVLALRRIRGTAEVRTHVLKDEPEPKPMPRFLPRPPDGKRAMAAARAARAPVQSATSRRWVPTNDRRMKKRSLFADGIGSTGKVRAALRTADANGMTATEIRAATGIKAECSRLLNVLNAMRDVEVDRSAGHHHYRYRLMQA